ncbi:MAG TPA: hypothetical protein PLK25_06135 [Bacteroidales bacterium]|nr:hypothetical protein [Bacteroidales bacterium]HON96786.1 hypothetical protein [Bacteroidales bacterium]HOU82008.1 hypothetical protein [Bacteroidales bacterium]HOV55134.1 hypothetical protein [Bacteroidales bacterium]HPX45954.1 hypothetical protein [Bacteroidales bacterium]
MKKILFIILVFASLLLASCKTRETCPAYNHGSSAEVSNTIANDKV